MHVCSNAAQPRPGCFSARESTVHSGQGFSVTAAHALTDPQPHVTIGIPYVIRMAWYFFVTL